MPKQVTNASRQARGLRRLTLWLPDYVLEQLDEVCDARRWSRAAVVRDLIECQPTEHAEQKKRTRKP